MQLFVHGGAHAVELRVGIGANVGELPVEAAAHGGELAGNGLGHLREPRIEGAAVLVELLGRLAAGAVGALARGCDGAREGVVALLAERRLGGGALHQEAESLAQLDDLGALRLKLARRLLAEALLLTRPARGLPRVPDARQHRPPHEGDGGDKDDVKGVHLRSSVALARTGGWGYYTGRLRGAGASPVCPQRAGAGSGCAGLLLRPFRRPR